MSKYIICCDFDGVLHGYQSGWKGPTVITDLPVPGALDWIVEMTNDDNYPRFEIAVYSSRSKEPGGIEAIKAWLQEHLTAWQVSMGDSKRLAASLTAMRIADRLTFPTQKPAASMTIDDRAFHFQGRFPDVESLLAFKPWTQIEPTRMRVYLDGIELHRDVVLSAKRGALGEVEVLLPVVKRTTGIGPEYVPLVERGKFHTVTLQGEVVVTDGPLTYLITVNGREYRYEGASVTYHDVAKIVGLTGAFSCTWKSRIGYGILVSGEATRATDDLVINAIHTDNA